MRGWLKAMQIAAELLEEKSCIQTSVAEVA